MICYRAREKIKTVAACKFSRASGELVRDELDGIRVIDPAQHVSDWPAQIVLGRAFDEISKSR